MAVGDTAFDFADLVDEAVTLSGGETATAADVTKIRRGLRLLTEEWAAEGYNTWRIVESSALSISASGVVTLPTDVDDVINVSAIRSGGTVESPMIRISATEYALLATKDTAGLPSQYWVVRTNAPTMKVFPIGSSGGGDTVKVTYVSRPAEFDRYDAVDDVPGRWLNALVAGLAHHLAERRPPFDEPKVALIARLEGKYLKAKDVAQRNDRDRRRYRMRF